jgi:hypothetical protein
MIAGVTASSAATGLCLRVTDQAPNASLDNGRWPDRENPRCIVTRLSTCFNSEGQHVLRTAQVAVL